MFSTPQNKRNPSYLVRNPHGYCFRLIVPGDLQDVVGKRELRYSLKTGYLSEGKSRARLLAGLIQQFFLKVRSKRPEYGRQQIESMLSGFLSIALEGSSSFQISDPVSNVPTAGYGPKLKGLVDEYLEENRRSGRWSKRTEKEYRNCFNVFLFYFGNVPIGHISHRTMQAYKKFLLKIPANFSKGEVACQRQGEIIRDLATPQKK